MECPHFWSLLLKIRETQGLAGCYALGSGEFELAAAPGDGEACERAYGGAIVLGKILVVAGGEAGGGAACEGLGDGASNIQCTIAGGERVGGDSGCGLLGGEGGATGAGEGEIECMTQWGLVGGGEACAEAREDGTLGVDGKFYGWD